MSRITATKSDARGKLGVAIGTLACIACILCAKGAETNTPDTKAVESNPTAVQPAKEIQKKTLSGAELYSMHCNRCHPERYPTERTAAQWKTILMHMRVRANLPAEQARTILKYLQENSGR
jgi:hypothetical protein